jgi:hypothetical protein
VPSPLTAITYYCLLSTTTILLPSPFLSFFFLFFTKVPSHSPFTSFLTNHSILNSLDFRPPPPQEPLSPERGEGPKKNRCCYSFFSIKQSSITSDIWPVEVGVEEEVVVEEEFWKMEEEHWNNS